MITKSPPRKKEAALRQAAPEKHDDLNTGEREVLS
jgi:hypothetical protein